MMDEHEHCPPDGQLLLVAEGEVPSADLLLHLEHCASCSKRVENLRESTRETLSVESSRPSVSESARAEPDSLPSVGKHLGIPEDPAAIGKFRIISRLGGGGQADVYRAVHPELETDVVIKLSRRTLVEDVALHEQLHSEARLLADLEHPNLGRVHDLDTHEGRPYLVLEYIRGRSLAQVASEEPIAPRRAAALLARVARAVGAAHRKGVVHKDIKPDNIVLDERDQPRLIDFGMGRLRHVWSQDAVEPGRIEGTIQFMAPEQARGDTKLVGPRSDIYALGGVLYFLLARRAPIESSDWRDALKRAQEGAFDHEALESGGFPRRLARICRKAMSPDPSGRHANADELAAELEAFGRSSRLLSWRALAALLILAGIGIWRWYPGAPTPVEETRSPASAEARLRVDIVRAGRELRLMDAVPLRNGDLLRIHGEVPAAAQFRAVLAWFDSEGQLHQLSPLGVSPSAGVITVTFPDPSRQDANSVEMAGPPGTECIFLCAGNREALTLEELKSLLGPLSPLPEMAADTVVEIQRSGVQPRRSRGPGELRRAPDGVLRRAERFWRRLTERCDWVAGVVFPHED